MHPKRHFSSSKFLFTISSFIASTYFPLGFPFFLLSTDSYFHGIRSSFILRILAHHLSCFPLIVFITSCSIQITCLIIVFLKWQKSRVYKLTAELILLSLLLYLSEYIREVWVLKILYRNMGPIV